MLLALALGWSGAPELPDVDAGDGAAPGDDAAPSDEAPAEDAASEESPAEEEPPAEESPTEEEPPAEEDAAAEEEPPTEEPPAPAPVVQKPTPPPQKPKPPPPRATHKPEPKPAETKPETKTEAPEDEDEDELEGDKPRYRRFKFLRLAASGKLGYTNGTSQRNGVFDKERTIESVMMGGTEPVAGENSEQSYGGGMGGGELDLEVFGINVWLDLQKFFQPGGMLALMVGYDHEFWFHERVRFDPGLGFGFMRIFLGGPLEDLYYNEDNVETTNIATAGIAGRLMLNLHIRIWGPFYTGPQFMLGYHYLFSANQDEVTKERGLHYSPAWNFRAEFVLPVDKKREKKKKRK